LNKIDVSKTPSRLTSVLPSDVCVFVDPLDATKEYTVGNLDACMSLVGIGYQGRAVAGVMHQPFVDDGKRGGNGTTIWGMIGVGSVGYTRKERNDGKMVLATTRTHGSEEVENAIKQINPSGGVIRVGGAGHKALLVLEGKADLYLFTSIGTKKWDTCAPEAIIKAAGGSLTDKR